MAVSLLYHYAENNDCTKRPYTASAKTAGYNTTWHLKSKKKMENAFAKEKRVIMKYSKTYTLMHATCCKVILDHAYNTNTYTVYFG